MVYARTNNLDEAKEELRTILDTAAGTLAGLPEAETSRPKPGGGWSRKQILGHLVDSAGVNLQRFLHAQVREGFALTYPQDEFVELNGYAERPFADILILWITLNRQLLHVVERIPEDKLDNLCGEGGGEDWTLRFRILDYVGHMQHHLDQIRDFPGEAQ